MYRPQKYWTSPKTKLNEMNNACLFRCNRPLIPGYAVHLIRGCRPVHRSEATLGEVLYNVLDRLSQGGT